MTASSASSDIIWLCFFWEFHCCSDGEVDNKGIARLISHLERLHLLTDERKCVLRKAISREAISMDHGLYMTVKETLKFQALAKENAISFSHIESCISDQAATHEEFEDENPGASRERSEVWKMDDFIYRGTNPQCYVFSDKLLTYHQNYSTTKELWNALEERYFTEDATSKKFIVSKFNSYKMVDSRPIMDQMYELEHIFSMFTQNNINMDESIQVASIIDKLPSTWKDVKKILKHRNCMLV
ncbi:hypothetical protein Tco_0939858 [Tanacetum coccineum]|uniref:Zinc finger, CCHC-type n=1 Tax=Tanacetum coccineum TaxID=301880 RepID=A0ABQ5DMZ8_9ASTR